MIASPKRSTPYPDRALDCEEALERPFRAVSEGLQEAGMSESAAGETLLEAAKMIESDWIPSEQLRSIRAWAVEIGWTETEVNQALVSLAKHNIAGIKADAGTEAGIRKARGSIH